MTPTPWQWQFPPIANITSLGEQLLKVNEELNEVVEAFFGGESPERIAEELMDLDQAKDGALRLLEKHGVDLDAVKRGVIEKNDERGYYRGAE